MLRVCIVALVIFFQVSLLQIYKVAAGISPIHDFKNKLNSKIVSERYLLKTPQTGIKHFDNSILKATKNVTQNPQMEENLYQISKNLVSAILTKLEIQDKITRITREALDAPGKNKGITAIETRRILDYISRTISSHILSITRASTEPELHRLVYGLAQIAAEVSIVSALKDITYAKALSKKQSVDLSLRKKRAIPLEDKTTPIPQSSSTLFSILLNKPLPSPELVNSTSPVKENKLYMSNAPYSVISSHDKLPFRVLSLTDGDPLPVKGFLNKTVLDSENSERINNESEAIVIEKAINGTHYVSADSQIISKQEPTAGELIDDWVDPKDHIYALNPDIVAEMELDQPEIDDESVNEKREKQKLERLELKAKKAILYAGDVAYLTAASVVAMRRALTASIEVNMSVKFAKNGMSNHQDLMMNLAKTAAQQAGKEAKSATSKSLACERVIKLAVKFTAQSQGAKLNHVANRIIMDTLSLATLAKSMAFVSSDIAINSLYQATDIKPPS
ncbi:uncharacterized protein LOC106716660 isoform X1 [Papilio machaon]|uniref:uncharacterized protein LOC106716660 isoform X1 n=1 Tax=Papilio machaon TaxID=76193 RepID=UPI001E663102|nr:uncharacterized protein LOC106716660 isoform X1 [Papilio machaon]